MIDIVAAVIVRNGRLLLTQRAPEQDAPWLWHCPGGKGIPGESREYAAIRVTREELGIDGPVMVSRNGRGTIEPIADIEWCASPTPIAQALHIAWYAVDIGDQKPLPIEGVGVGWFDAGALFRMAARSGQFVEARASRVFVNAIITEPTERALPALLEHLRKCASTPASLPGG